MKKIILNIIVLLSIVLSCKEQKTRMKNTKGKIDHDIEEKKEDLSFPTAKDVIQLNEIEYRTNNITLTKVHVKDSKDNSFIFKIFLEIENIEKYKNGDYAFFIQNFPYEEDASLLDDNFKKAGIASYWINLKSAKPYQNEYVLFKAFESEIINFKKTVVGIMNIKTKKDIFRVTYDDTVIIN